MIEIPKGSRNKYEWDPKLQAIKLNRFLFSSVVYPTDYGFITDTLGEQGEELDAIVCVNAATFPGCLIEVRAVGVLRLDDEEGRSDKLVCVPARRPGVGRGRGHRRAPEPAAHRDRALLLDVQAARGQGGRGPRLGGPRRRREGDRGGPQAPRGGDARNVGPAAVGARRLEVVRRPRGPVRARPRARRGGAHRRARAQRRRQVDAAADPRRRRAPRRRHGHEPPRPRARVAAPDRRGRRPRRARHRARRAPRADRARARARAGRAAARRPGARRRHAQDGARARPPGAAARRSGASSAASGPRARRART